MGGGGPKSIAKRGAARTRDVSISRIEISVPIEIEAEAGPRAARAEAPIGKSSRREGTNRLAALWVDFAAGLAVSTRSYTNVMYSHFGPGVQGARAAAGAHEPGN